MASINEIGPSPFLPGDIVELKEAMSSLKLPKGIVGRVISISERSPECIRIDFFEPSYNLPNYKSNGFDHHHFKLSAKGPNNQCAQSAEYYAALTGE